MKSILGVVILTLYIPVLISLSLLSSDQVGEAVPSPSYSATATGAIVMPSESPVIPKAEALPVTKKVAVSKPAAVTKKLSVEKQTVHSKYWTLFVRYCPDQLHILPALCYSENRGQVDDKVGPGGRGACMVGPVHQWRAGSGSLMNPDVNVRVACEIIREQGAGPWTDYGNGNYLQYNVIQ